MVEIMCARPAALERLDIISRPLYISIVILINEERLNDKQEFCERTDERGHIEFVQDMVNDLHKQVTLLVFECTLHEQGRDLVEERTSTKLASLVSDYQEESY
jgi:hypothetical protein